MHHTRSYEMRIFSLFTQEGEFFQSIEGPYEIAIKPSLDNWDGFSVEGSYSEMHYYSIEKNAPELRGVFNTNYITEDRPDSYVVYFEDVPAGTAANIQGEEYIVGDTGLTIGFSDKEDYHITLSHLKYLPTTVEVSNDRA